jgi:hypothetical protein
MTAAENHLIELLPRSDRRRLLAICEPADLVMAQVLLVTPIGGKPALEVGMVGREGMVRSRRPVCAFISSVRAWRAGC